KLSHSGMLDHLREKGCKIGGITLGERGLVWYDETGQRREMPSLAIPKEKVIDTNGAGDVFHGAYVFSYLQNPDASWESHFQFSRAASAHKIQRLGNEAGLPTLDDVKAMLADASETV